MRTTRVMIVSRVFPYPPNVGKKAVLAGYVDFLLSLGPGIEVSYVVVGDRIGDGAPEGVSFHPVARPSTASKLLALLRRVVLGSWSVQEALLATPDVRHALDREMDRIDPDVVICDTVRIGRLFADTAARGDHRRRWILYVDDLFSVRYRNILAGLARGEPVGDVLGAFEGDVPRLARPLVRWRPVLERLLRLEADRIERSTAELCGLFDEAVILNEDEAGQLRALAPGAAIRLLPPYKSRPATVTPRRWHGDPLFVILGNLGYAANEAALQQFIALALPEIRRSMPQARIAVVGAGGSAKLIEQIRAVGPPLDYQGYVEDLGAVLSNAAALLAPITIGSGVKIKILDALAYGLPVVTTPLGVSGTNLRDGAEVLIAERIEDFPAKMARLLDRATNDRMSATVRLHFEAVYSQSATENAYRECILGAPDGPAPNVRTLQAG